MASTTEALRAHDIIARQVIYPTAFDGDVISANALVQFLGNRESHGGFDESLILERAVPQDQIFAHGCEYARNKNAQQQSKRIAADGMLGSEVSPDKRKYYAGYTRAAVKELSLRSETFYVDLVWDKKDFDAHVTVSLKSLRPDAKVSPADKTAAGRALARKFANPEPHICQEDRGDPLHPLIRNPDALVLPNQG